jgi:endonuclease YncB( thermonuclease family)
MRFKVRLEGENCYIALSLIGLRTLQSDKNQPALLEFANEALNFAKDHLFQRDVTVELYSADKRGTFFGTVLTPSKQDFSLKLVEEGLASVNVLGNERRMPSNFA